MLKTKINILMNQKHLDACATSFQRKRLNWFKNIHHESHSSLYGKGFNISAANSTVLAPRLKEGSHVVNTSNIILWPVIFLHWLEERAKSNHQENRSFTPRGIIYATSHRLPPFFFHGRRRWFIQWFGRRWSRFEDPEQPLKGPELDSLIREQWKISLASCGPNPSTTRCLLSLSIPPQGELRPYRRVRSS